MKFGFGFRSTNSSSGGSLSSGGVGHISRGRSKRIDDRPFPPQLEEHPYFNYFPVAQQNYYTRYVPRAPPAYQLPPPPPAPPLNAHPGGQMRRRHGSFSEQQQPASKFSQNFHFRSRSSSGRFRHMKTPADYHRESSRSNDHLDRDNNNEPIYSEPFPPENNDKLKFFPDPRDPVQISHHIYEYLVSKRNHKNSQTLNCDQNRRGSLSSSPSDGSSTNQSAKQASPDFSSGKKKDRSNTKLGY